MRKEAAKITLGHGGGGRLAYQLLRQLILPRLDNPVLSELTDAAVIKHNFRLAFSTDSFVVYPLFFSGGDIGKLAVFGTVNDLVMVGAQPEYLSLAFILEEGLEFRVLERIVKSISEAAHKAGVRFVTGDTKVVERGACDKIFINSSGIGRLIRGIRLGPRYISKGDRIIVTGAIGQHGLAVLTKRNNLSLDFDVVSDCAPLADLLLPILKNSCGIKFMRDPTRGGLATTLNEIAEATGLAVFVDEAEIPIDSRVRAACELLGIDPLYLACEGRALLVVKKESVSDIISQLHRHRLGHKARVIGEIVSRPCAKVILKTVAGGSRILDMLTNEPLPRIC